MAGDVGKIRRQYADVRCHNATGNRRKAADHHGVQLRLRESTDERLDHERRLRHAYEDIPRHREGFGARRAHCALHDPGDATDQTLHDAEVIEHRRERREEDDCRQDGEREICARVRPRFDGLQHGHIGGASSHRLADRHIVANQITEDETRSILGECEQLSEDSVGTIEQQLPHACLEYEEAKHQLQAYAETHEPPIDVAAVGRKHPGNPNHHGHAHHSHSSLKERCAEPFLHGRKGSGGLLDEPKSSHRTF